MYLQRNCSKFFAFALLALVAVMTFAAIATAAVVPLRSGTVISKLDTSVYSAIKAVDDGGKEFWVITSICTIGEKGRIAVLVGAHHDKVKTEQHGILEDVYFGYEVRLGDTKVVGFGAHKLPDGCVLME